MEPPSAAAMSAFRRGRRHHTLLSVWPVAFYTLVALSLGADPTAVRLGLVVLVVAGTAAYYGRAPGRAISPAMFIGLAPFVVSHVAQSGGHLCVGGICASWCLPACAATGVLAGALFAARAHRDPDPMRFFATGVPIITLIGAMGCQCLGYGSVLGLLAGLTLASAPRWPAWVRGAAA